MPKTKQPFCSVCKTGPNEDSGKCIPCRRKIQRDCKRKRNGTIIRTHCECGNPLPPLRRKRCDKCQILANRKSARESAKAFRVKQAHLEVLPEVKKPTAKKRKRKVLKKTKSKPLAKSGMNIVWTVSAPQPVVVPPGFNIQRIPMIGPEWGRWTR